MTDLRDGATVITNRLGVAHQGPADGGLLKESSNLNFILSSQMPSGRTRNGSGAQPARTSRWLIRIAVFAGIVAAGLLMSALLRPHNESVQAKADLCPHFDVDPNTAKMRNRGMIPCTAPAEQNSRIDLIRKTFNQH